MLILLPAQILIHTIIPFVLVYGCVNQYQLLLPVLYNKACMVHQIVIVNMHFAHCEFICNNFHYIFCTIVSLLHVLNLNSKSVFLCSDIYYFTYMWVPTKSIVLVRDDAFSNIAKQRLPITLVYLFTGYYCTHSLFIFW